MLFGEIVAESGWSVADAFLVIKVLVGVLAAGVGAVAVTAAARDDQAPAGLHAHRPCGAPVSHRH
jgi:hypothetical protein